MLSIFVEKLFERFIWGKASGLQWTQSLVIIWSILNKKTNAIKYVRFVILRKLIMIRKINR